MQLSKLLLTGYQFFSVRIPIVYGSSVTPGFPNLLGYICLSEGVHFLYSLDKLIL